jgi:hypothetical protein
MCCHCVLKFASVENKGNCETLPMLANCSIVFCGEMPHSLVDRYQEPHISVFIAEEVILKLEAAGSSKSW